MDWNVTELGSVPCSPLTSPGTAGKWLLAGDTTVFTTAPTSEVPAALVGSKTSSWVPAEDTAAGGHLVTENTCVVRKELPGSSSERCTSLCPCSYTPTCSWETRALFHWDPQAGVVSEEPADIRFCQGLTGTLSLSHQKMFLDQQLLFVK